MMEYVIVNCFEKRKVIGFGLTASLATALDETIVILFLGFVLHPGIERGVFDAHPQFSLEAASSLLSSRPLRLTILVHLQQSFTLHPVHPQMFFLGPRQKFFSAFIE